VAAAVAGVSWRAVGRVAIVVPLLYWKLYWKLYIHYGRLHPRLSRCRALGHVSSRPACPLVLPQMLLLLLLLLLEMLLLLLETLLPLLLLLLFLLLLHLLLLLLLLLLEVC